MLLFDVGFNAFYSGYVTLMVFHLRKNAIKALMLFLSISVFLSLHRFIKMANNVSLVKIKEFVNRYFADNDEIMAVYIYGSVVSGKDKESSDIDIALLARENINLIDSYEARVCYANDIARLVKKDVDVVFLQDVGDILAFQVLRNGVVVVDKDREFRCSFTALRLIQCLDFQFYEKRMQRGMIAAMRRDSNGR